MKDLSPALVTYLNSRGGKEPLLEWDFYTFTLADGTQLRYGTAGFDITFASAGDWSPPALDGSGGMWRAGISWPPSRMGVVGDYGNVGHWKVGLGSDSFSLLYTPLQTDPITGELFPDQINGLPWLQAARSGMLDHADVIVSTAYYSAMPTGPIPPGGAPALGSVITARGVVGNVDCSDTAAYITITDYRSALGQMMPRKLYQAHCHHTVYDARCGLDRVDFTETGEVLISVGPVILATAPIPAPAGSGTYNLGLMTMTSGPNAGISRLIIQWDGATFFQLLAPFPNDTDFANSTTFEVSAGCDKTVATCSLFGNKPNFSGEPYVPIPETVIS